MKRKLNINILNYDLGSRVIYRTEDRGYIQLTRSLYHYIIMPSGEVEECNKDFDGDIYICLIEGADPNSDFTFKDTRSPEQTKSLFTLICQSVLYYDIDVDDIFINVYLRLPDHPQTTSMGKAIDLDKSDIMREMEKWLYDDMLGSDDN